ncbi:recombinase family protein [Nocardia farcinica]
MTRAYGWQADGRTVDPAEAAEVRRWAAYLLDTEADPPPTLRGLANDLAARGISTVTGAPWRSVVIRRALTSPRMIGKKFNPAGELVDVDVEAILDLDTWQRLRDLLLDPERQKFAPTRDEVNLMSGGLAVCDHCGKPLAYNGVRSKWPTVVACSVRGGGCGKVTISAALLEADVVERVLARLTDRTYRRKLSRALAKARTTEHGEVLDDLRRRLAQLGEDFADGRIERETLLAGTERLRANIATAQAQRARVEAFADLPDPSIDEVLAWWEQAGPARQREIVAVLLDRVVVRGSEGRSVLGADRLDYHWRAL